MLDKSEQYWDAIAKYYDDENTFDNDVQFYLKHAPPKPGPVLELGCGSGRVIGQLLERGYDVTGVDYSQRMLDLADQKIRAIQGTDRGVATLLKLSLADYDLQKQFEYILIPYNTLCLLNDFREQEKALHAVHKHLSPTGTFICTVFNPDLELITQKYPLMKHAGAWKDSGTGHDVDTFEVNYCDQANQIIFGIRYYDEIDDDGYVLRTRHVFEVRYFFSYELQVLLEKCGFVPRKIYGDFDGRGFTNDSPQIIFECTKLP